jgi:uncharacterized membrane protein YcaP (DUF421 family)
LFTVAHARCSASLLLSPRFWALVKGQQEVLVLNGRLQPKNMRWNQVSEHDLQEDMRLDAKTENLSTIKVARVECSGDISLSKADQ